MSNSAEYQREYRRRNPDNERAIDLKRHYGLTLEDYNVLLEEQGGVCAVCRKAPGSVGTGNKSKGTLAVDHCHITGTYRGLLCTNCNLGLGSFFDNPELLLQAAMYLKEHQLLVEGLLAKKVQVVEEQIKLVDACLEELGGP